MHLLHVFIPTLIHNQLCYINPEMVRKINSTCFGHASSLLSYMLTQWEIHDVLLEASSENKPEEGTMHPGIHDGMTSSLPFPLLFPERKCKISLQSPYMV